MYFKTSTCDVREGEEKWGENGHAAFVFEVKRFLQLSPPLTFYKLYF